uniref:Ig-like domain-containing protein n=1 Tax=Periophthalmus magnuspinnatus TaxID=409849 RepID=A0A3B4AFZ6_9GOBI
MIFMMNPVGLSMVKQWLATIAFSLNRIAANTKGNVAILRCELSKPGYSVEWRRRGEEHIRNGEKYHIRQRETLVELRICDVMPEDSDIYTCVCENIETTATLTKLKNIQIEEGLNITLHCEVSKPNVPVEWSLGGELLENEEKYQIKEREDSGVYTCTCREQRTKSTVKVVGMLINFTLKNQQIEEGSSVTLRCELSKKGVPVQWQRNGTRLKNQQVEEENNLTLSCELSKPGLNVEWRKGEEILKSNFKYQIKNRESIKELIIKNAQLDDTGLYSCTYGDVKTIANITITRKKP